jgi:hypothetical protein
MAAETVRVDADELFRQVHLKYNQMISNLVSENARLQAALNQQTDVVNELNSKLAAINPAE